jgi:uncharacterized membrane protein
MTLRCVRNFTSFARLPPPPLWGRVREGGRASLAEKRIAHRTEGAARPPSLTLPHKGGGNRVASLVIPALFALAISTAPAGAALRVCNKTRYLLNFAVGYAAGADFATEGWWSVTPNTCATPVKGPLRGRYVYLYATDIDANDVLKGSVSMCIDRRKFQIFGLADCWRRGLQAVNFAEIDTLSSPDWTAYLSDAGK